MKKVTQIKEQLETILNNFKRKGSATYTLPTLEEKEQEVNELLEEAESLKPHDTTLGKAQELIQLYTAIKNLGKEIRVFIKTHRDRHNKKIKQNMAFDIKTATSLIPQYSGKEEDTESFLDAISLLDDITTEAAQKPTMIKFIKTRITGRAKIAITDDLTTVEAIKQKIKQKFSIKLSSDAILAQLKATQQGSRKLVDYISQVENLASQLTKAFIAENVASGESAENLAEKFARQVLIDNVANPETSIILKATSFTKLSDIAAKAIAIDRPIKANVLHFKTQSRPNFSRFGHNNNTSRTYNNQNQNSNERWYRPNNWQQRQNSDRYATSANLTSGNRNRYPYNNNNSNNSNTQGRFNNANNRNSGGFRNQRVHYCSGEYQTPQQDADPSPLGGQD